MTVWFDPERGKWRYHFQLRKRRRTGYCIDPKTEADATNRSEAVKIERQIRAAIERADDADVEEAPAPDTYTLAMAIAAWKPRKDGTDNWVNLRTYTRELLIELGPATPLAEITAERIWEYIVWARKQPIMIWCGGGITREQAAERNIPESKLWRTSKRLRTDSTINRYLNVLREVIRIASKTPDPATGQPRLPFPPEVPELEEPQYQPNPIADEDLAAIIAAASSAGLQHVADAAFLVRNMGFRKAEVFAIRLDEIRRQPRGVRIPAERTKGNREEFIPANDAAWELIERLVAQAKAWKSDRLINFRRAYRSKDGRVTYGVPRPISNPDRAWHKALELAGLEGRYIFHNTKASFVTDHAGKNSDKVTQAAARHKDGRTTARYIKFANKQMQEAMQAIEFRLPTGTDGPAAVPDPHTGTRTRRRRGLG